MEAPLLPMTGDPGLSLEAASPQPAQQEELTDQGEINSFYLYSWASEVFIVCAMGSFIPLTLEQLARARGVLASDRTTPCTHEIDLEPPVKQGFHHELFTRSIGRAEQCVCTIGGFEINTASFAMYVFSASVFFQALVIVSISGAADHSNHRKLLLMITAFLGALATIGFVLVTPDTIMVAAFLAIAANTFFGASFVLLNSYLPLLSRNHKDVRTDDVSIADDASIGSLSGFFSDGASETVALDVDEAVESRPLLSAHSPTESVLTTRKTALEASAEISSFGVRIGYLAAIIVQITCIGIVMWFDKADSLFALRLSLCFIGSWWLLFTIPAISGFKARPGDPLKLSFEDSRRKHPTSRLAHVRRNCRISWAYVSVSWNSLFRTIGQARQLKDLGLFLMAWFFLSDGIATTSGTAILFAKTSLNMSSSAVALISILSTISGVLGAMSWPKIARWFGWTVTQTMLACNVIFAVIPLYGLLGFVPGIAGGGFGGLQSPAEIYGLAILYGFQLGGISAFCRSVYGELIPPRSEATFYALHAITDKGSSIFGPMVAGYITTRFGEIRPSFWFLAVLVLAAIPLLASVDPDRGREKARELAGVIAGDDVVNRRDRMDRSIQLRNDDPDN